MYVNRKSVILNNKIEIRGIIGNCYIFEWISLDHILFVKKVTIILFLLVALIPGMAFGLQNSEEEREVVQRVYFEGNEEYANMVLRGIIATTQPGFFNRLLGRYGNYPYSEEEVRRDVIRIERFYQRRGFHEIDRKSTRASCRERVEV